MSQFGTPTRRLGGELDVYTALLGIAALVLIAGIAVLAMRNMEHSKASDRDQGGLFAIVQ